MGRTFLALKTDWSSEYDSPNFSSVSYYDWSDRNDGERRIAKACLNSSSSYVSALHFQMSKDIECIWAIDVWRVAKLSHSKYLCLRRIDFVLFSCIVVVIVNSATAYSRVTWIHAQYYRKDRFILRMCVPLTTSWLWALALKNYHMSCQEGLWLFFYQKLIEFSIAVLCQALKEWSKYRFYRYSLLMVIIYFVMGSYFAVMERSSTRRLPCSLKLFANISYNQPASYEQDQSRLWYLRSRQLITKSRVQDCDELFMLPLCTCGIIYYFQIVFNGLPFLS